LEVGLSPKVALVKDVAPEVTGPTFRVVPHVRGSVCGWKGVHRVPLKNGKAIVGMTQTYSDPCDVIGDGPGLMTRIGQTILNHPIISALVSPEAYIATKVLMDPGTQHALNTTADAAKSAAKPDDGWPAVWGANPKRNTTLINQMTAARGLPTGHRSGPADTTSLARTRTTPSSGNPAAYAASQQGTQSGATQTPINPMTGQPMPAAGINPMTGQPYPGVFPGAINPMTGQPMTPGQPGPLLQQLQQMQQQMQQMQAQQSYGGGGGGYGGGGMDFGPSPYSGGGGPTAADFGLPTTPDPGSFSGGGYPDGGGFGDTTDAMSAADASAYDSYTDPSAAIGYWNT
jgi:hypothetical protein